MEKNPDKFEHISGLGPAMRKKLESLDIHCLEDLLYHFPFRYEDYSATQNIRDLRPGTHAHLIGHIEIINNKRSQRRRINVTEALISDDSAQIRAVWFNQPFISRTLKAGDKISLTGKVESDWGGVYLPSPAYEKVWSGRTPTAPGIIPIYRSTAGLSQKQLRGFIRSALNTTDLHRDWLDTDILKRLCLLSLSEALRLIHFPRQLSDTEQARRRLGFDEIFLIQIRSQIARRALAGQQAEAIAFHEEAVVSFVKSLPFTLTDAQKKTAWRIITDMGRSEPMSRLLEGDVGSGKTVVAAIAMLAAVADGRQAAIMVPTEVLATQHFESLYKLFSESDCKLVLATGSKRRLAYKGELKDLKKKELAEMLALGDADIAIGTHALIQDGLSFSKLGLVIIDEQHRFGVEQRQALSKQSGGRSMPHLLSMTATPIPRSLALAIYGDLDLSIIDQMPSGRLPIKTQVVAEDARSGAYTFIDQEIKKGRQAFFICPLIDPSDKLGYKSAKEEYERLRRDIFSHWQIGLLHGRLKSEEKDTVMADFQSGRTQILVATSVIEVGIDVPNASVMAIEGADHFGLAQLHQFRGRVGRGAHQSYCFLFADETEKERLRAMEKYNDGFSLAKIDLQLRGPGEVYGTAQKGFPELKIANLFDHDLMQTAQTEAQTLLDKDPDLSKHPATQEKLRNFFHSQHLE